MEEFSGGGKSDFVFKEKLKLFKGSLIRWKYKVFGRINLKVGENI